MHGHLCPQLAQVMDEIEGEAVVVVDQDNHAPGQRFRSVYGRAGRGSSRRGRGFSALTRSGGNVTQSTTSKIASTPPRKFWANARASARRSARMFIPNVQCGTQWPGL